MFVAVKRYICQNTICQERQSVMIIASLQKPFFHNYFRRALYPLWTRLQMFLILKIYVDIDKSVQKSRFFERAAQRGLGASANGIFENASKKAQIYIHPCAQCADIILNGQVCRANYKKFVASMLSVLSAAYFAL